MTFEIANFAHDLKNQLAIVKGHLNLSIKHFDGDREKAAFHMGKCMDGINSCANFCASTLEPAMQEMNLGEFVKKLSAEMSDHFDNGPEFQVYANDEVTLRNVDPILLKNCLINIYKNAVAVGATTILTRINLFEILVIDNGPGFPEAFLNDRQKFLEKHNQDNQGHGFGISSIEGFCKSMKWSLGFENAKSSTLGAKVMISFKGTNKFNTLN